VSRGNEPFEADGDWRQPPLVDEGASGRAGDSISVFAPIPFAGEHAAASGHGGCRWRALFSAGAVQLAEGGGCVGNVAVGGDGVLGGDGHGGQVLRTAPDATSADNLDNLPLC
jgi:hypothetical protein